MSDFDPERIYRQLQECGEDWADKNAAAELLEETKKIVLAELASVEHGSISAREALALANPAYKLHIANMVAARKEANRAKVKYDSMKVLAELRRSEAATRRAEMTLR